jgi:hypothetical protein
MQYNFGVGSLVLLPPSTAADISPLQVGILKDVSLEVGFSMKELIGANSFPIDVARATGKIAGKSKSAQIRAGLINAILGNATQSTGHVFLVPNVSTGVIGGAAFDTGFVKANFVDDLGVIDETGAPMTLVTGAPAAGQYQLNKAGANVIYTFNAAANGKTYTLSYTKLDSVNGKTVSLTNQAMGANVQFALTLFNSFRSKDFGIKLFAVAVPKINLALKNEDFMEKDLEFQAFTDPATNKVIEFYTSE